MHAKTLGVYGPKLTQETIDRLEQDYEAVKPLFWTGTRMRASWTKLDTAALALKAGAGYQQLYLDAFYKPTLEIHATATAMMGRIELTEKGMMSFASGSTRIKARQAIVMAHNLLLRVLDSHNTHFKLGMDEVLQSNLEDFKKAYRSPSSEER
jgi:hypothetical protein